MNSSEIATAQRCRAFFFDLDGVVIDSIADIESAVNSVITNNGYSALSREQVVRCVGAGARKLLTLAFIEAAKQDDKAFLDFESPVFDKVFQSYLTGYEKNSVEKSTVYPDVRELLIKLQQHGIPTAVVSNKPHGVAVEAMKHLDIYNLFDIVVCPEQVTNLKPHPEELFYALKSINANRGIDIQNTDVLMVGDSASDIQAGRAFGGKTCAITGGYGDPAELLVEKADIVIAGAGELGEAFVSRQASN
jgi:2-phosphoglycolate phosphatase